jgi:N6-adenosine-specific RNA methylase IME4
MEKSYRNLHVQADIAMPYRTMPLEDIQALPVTDLADDRGCHLYLWTTQHFVPQALDIALAWGFRYECLLTWHKPGGFAPFSWQYNAEHVVFARRGSLAHQLPGKLKICFEAPRGRHSEKPARFFDLARQASPGPRLEMFARAPHEGFQPWGNEVVAT